MFQILSDSALSQRWRCMSTWPLGLKETPSDSNDSLSSAHPLLTFFLGHLFDGIAEHGAGHLMGMLAEELTEEVHGHALTHLAEHPADGFVHQVMRMMEMDLGIAEAP